MRVRDLGGADLTAYQPRKDARFALTLVEQLTACAETLRRLASLAWADGQNLGRAGDLVDNRPSDRTRVVFIPGRVQPNLNHL